MADFNALEDSFSSRQGNTTYYLCELNNVVERRQTDAGQQADITSTGITCTKCRKPVDNYDPGSQTYQEHYAPPLPAICDKCLDKIFVKVKRHNRRG
jgi:hypothetical protein